ncbi:MAG: alpha/beta hydrolase-fold protein [Opitutae bacterium]
MPNPPPTTATLRLHRRFRSPSMRTSRDVVVWLPPGYEGTHRRHPVVYFQDGQNIFDPLTAFLGNAWHAGERATELIAAGKITAPIMVGIYNRGFDRMSEYAPTPAEFSGWDGEKCRSKGQAKRYVNFVARELKLFIDAHYRTLKGPKHTAVVGSSMGGLVSLYFALWQPRVFGHVVALSPSLWWDDRVVIKAFARLRKKPAVRLWLDMGTAEPGWETVQVMRDGLVKRGWKPGRDLHYSEIVGAEHSEHAWSARIGDVLKWLWAEPRP